MSCHGPLKRLPNPIRPYGPTKRNFDSKVYSFNHLKASFDQLRTGGQASGLDGITYNFLSDYEWEIKLKTLSSRIKKGAYKPSRPRTCPIPKENGGNRTLSIPNIMDRVVSKACLNAIGNTLEDIFLCWSYAFRPHKSTFEVFAHLIQDFNNGLNYCCHYDIVKAFDNIDIRKVKASIRNLSIERSTKDLLLTIVGGHNSFKYYGLNQGDPLSGALFNLYLHDYHDLNIANYINNDIKVYRYADDLVIMGRHQGDVAAVLDASKNQLRACSLDCVGNKVIDLHNNNVDILGLTISGNTNKLSFSLPYATSTKQTGLWHKLDNSMEKAHQTANPARTIRQALQGTLEAIAPVELTEDHQREVNRLLEKHGILPIDIKQIDNTKHWKRVLNSLGLEHAS